ncbi:MAG: hypothetical protein QNI99_05060 [Woeseiaceae bacterium]|nr:hypothetical protein [Woeseiaceae bacterium]
MHKCPLCQSPVDTKPAYSRYSDRFGSFPPNQGIRCTGCNTVLKVSAPPAMMLNLATIVATAVAIALINAVMPGALVLAFAVVASAAILWISGNAHRFIKLSAPRIDENLLSDDYCWPDRFEDDFEPTEEELREFEVIVGIPGASVDRDWTCSVCGEKNTKEFAICWNCGSPFNADNQ